MDFFAPYIGSNYYKYRILLVGESHYFSNKQNFSVKDWYDNKIILTEELKKQCYTKSIVNDFLNGKKKIYTIYRFPAKVIGKLLNKNDYEAFTYVAFFNFFQRPNFQKGSIDVNDLDIKYGNEAFKKNYEMLKPQITLFLSKKAFECLENKYNCHCLVHPSSAWWYKNDGKLGCKKMEELLGPIIMKGELK